MAQISFRTSPILTCGELPQIGSQTPKFELVRSSFSPFQDSHLQGQKTILYLFPSIDTSVCSLGIQKFNEQALLYKLTIVGVSMDLPFALGRYLKNRATDLDNVILTSAFRAPTFGTDFGALITNGQLEGFLSRAVISVNEQGTVVYAEQVPEIIEEPNYQAAARALTAS